jgi:phosphoribosylanthranilate isomerase
MTKPCPIEIKICGLTNTADALCAVDNGASWLGFVFYDKSPRHVTCEQVKAIRANLPAWTRLVGVFVNASRGAVCRIATACNLHAVQIHGDEAATDFGDLPLPVWRAVRATEKAAWIPDPADWPAMRYVVDAMHPSAYGGTGTVADWNSAAILAARFPCMLAGGLTPDNVGAAIRRVNPLGVDVSSGIETAPGRKNHNKIKEFMAAARSTARPDTRVHTR